MFNQCKPFRADYFKHPNLTDTTSLIGQQSINSKSAALAGYNITTSKIEQYFNGSFYAFSYLVINETNKIALSAPSILYPDSLQVHHNISTLDLGYHSDQICYSSFNQDRNVTINYFYGVEYKM